MQEKHRKKVFERYWNRNEIVFQPKFPEDTEIIVIIPVLNDSDIFLTIDSLCQCSHLEGSVGVIIVVNHGEQLPEYVKEANRLLTSQLYSYVNVVEREGIVFQIMEAFDLPAKNAGVGLARKLAMDAAAWWLYVHAKSDCPIASLDADTWVDANYTDAIIRCFKESSKAGVSISYAHRLNECKGDMLTAIVKYELYLRYYQLALAYAGHPHAYHCIGSAFAVRAMDYVAEGGMNKRQAGEDFYFIQKLISTGRYGELRETKVYPSARCSDRTPFGTGRSVQQIMTEGTYFVYNWNAFEDLKHFFEGIDCLYKASPNYVEEYMGRQVWGLQKYWKQMEGGRLLAEINANCASVEQFHKRFFDGFNAFRVLKYLNYMHENDYMKIEVSEAVSKLFSAYGWPEQREDLEYLMFLRNL